MPSFAYDIESDAMYLTISDQEIAQTIELTEQIYVDVDEYGGVVGIEYIGIILERTARP